MMKYIIAIIFCELLIGCGGTYSHHSAACNNYVVTWLDEADETTVSGLRSFAVSKIVEPYDFVLSTNISNIENDYLCASTIVPGKHFIITEYKL